MEKIWIEEIVDQIYIGDFEDMPLEEAIEMFEEYIELRDKHTDLKLDIDYDSYDRDNGVSYILIKGKRIENDTEFEKRKEKEEKDNKNIRDKKKKKAQDERATYERLKKKFGDD